MDGVNLKSTTLEFATGPHVKEFLSFGQFVFELVPLNVVAETFDKVQGCVANYFMLLDDLACPSAHTASDIDDIVAFFL